MELFWELHQHRGIANAEMAASDAKHRARESQRRLLNTERQAEKALFLCEVLWSLLHEKLGVSEAELLQRIRDVDSTDGKLDGKVRRPPVPCPKCNRDTTQRFPNCMYCGAPVPASPFA